jgi:cytidylate kinase
MTLANTAAGRGLIVAIDGPAGAGKSTLAKRLAERFGLLNLETGAMYRAFALKALQAKVPVEDAPALEALSRSTTIRIEPGEASNLVYLDGCEVSSQLREQAITDAASRVSVHPAIRSWMVHLQQQIARSGNVVMEGRDIGTVVFPDADVKIFLDAAPEARGQRRFEQMGSAPTLPQEAIVKELRQRDERDRNRAQSPLKPAPDAITIDSTSMTLDQVVERASFFITERRSAAGRVHPEG